LAVFPLCRNNELLGCNIFYRSAQDEVTLRHGDRDRTAMEIARRISFECRPNSLMIACSCCLFALLNNQRCGKARASLALGVAVSRTATGELL
jgi:hypothetical protein